MPSRVAAARPLSGRPAARGAPAVHNGGMATRTETGSARDAAPQGQDLRALGALEQAFHLYMHRNPINIALTAHLDGAPTQQRLRAALDDLQRVHPQLSAAVVDRGAAAGQTAVLSRVVVPAPLTVHPAGTTWQQVAAGEQARAFDAANGPLWRAALVPPSPADRPDAPAGATLVLTFDHRVADGVAVVRVLRDLLATLNGHHLPAQPVPAAQEDLLDGLAGDAARADADPGQGAATPEDPRMGVRGALRPFDATPPEVTGWALDARATTELVAAARAHGTTVQGALCAAATQVLQRAGRDFVRIITPKDLRRGLGLHDDVALRLMPSRTGFDAQASGDFWDLARATTDVLAATRAPAAVLAASDALRTNLPGDADAGEALMLAITSMDMMVTNLGVVDVPETGPLHVTGVEGLTMSVRIVGEQILGVLTFAGRLRMTNTTHDPVPHLLRDIAGVLSEASR